MVFFGKAGQIINFQQFIIICLDPPGIAPEHLVYFAEDQQQVGASQALFEGCEFDLQLSPGICEIPGSVIILFVIGKFDLVKFMNLAVQD